MKNILLMLSGTFICIFSAQPVYAMHIMEGFLPIQWSIFWFLLTLPFLIKGILSIKKLATANIKFKMLLVFAGAFTFVLSALKMPSVTGSCSHPTGVGFGSIMFGPTAMTVLSSIVLLFQALLLAHGGLTTLGANIFSMGIVGPLVAFGVYRSLQKFNAPVWFSIFLAASLGDLSTYITTAFQLSLAFPAETGGVLISFAKFLTVFAFTQIPLAVSEGILTVVVFNFLMVNSPEELQKLKVIEVEEV